ncbi:hypothetical protein UFOVP54_200 [uncultured Caudovirales phage]|uniref:Uncharacterized protein n=1 Tax=uncultured Caudovirales phage TaxID=2100421 RepID=A0A6J5KWI8_9CAUD|nr:hypothetical protein UFOVP54_200 [uncultured Caudovirales phage]
MAALTDNKYDVYNWITKVIDSCKNYHHFRNANTLIDNFSDRYQDWEISGSLRNYLHDKQFR